MLYVLIYKALLSKPLYSVCILTFRHEDVILYLYPTVDDGQTLKPLSSKDLVGHSLTPHTLTFINVSIDVHSQALC